TSASDPSLSGRAVAGVVMSQLRVGEFRAALQDAELLSQAHRDNSLVVAVRGDALWAAGMFQEAEEAYDTALKLDPLQPRALHGRARSLSARNQLTAALADAQEALRLDPREGEYHNTAGAIYERMHLFEEAAAAFGNYVNLLPERDRNDRALWARETIRFLHSFDNRKPLDMGEGATRACGPWRSACSATRSSSAPRSTAPCRISCSTPAQSRQSSRASSRVTPEWRRSPIRKARASATSASADCRSAASTRSRS